MKKILRSFTLLFFALSITACVEKSITTTTTQQPTPRVSTPIPSTVATPVSVRTPIPTPVPLPMPTSNIVTAPSTAGETHQLKTIQGSMLTVQERSNGFVFPQYPNKIILLQIFGQDCPYCFEEMPIIHRVKQKYAGNLQVIALQAQEDMSKETASRLIQQFDMNYPILDKSEATDLLHWIQVNYEWTGVLPYMLIIKNGVTEYSFSGAVSHQELNEAVQSLI